MSAPLAPSGFRVFERRDWAALSSDGMPALSETQLSGIGGLNDPITRSEIEGIYLPLSRLIDLHVSATRAFDRTRQAFLRQPPRTPPFVIGVAGSVAAGKSTLARALRTVIAEWPGRPKVEIVTTDGFLHPTSRLVERGLMSRKGFPESYDLRRMIGFLRDLKSGEPEIDVPVYSHRLYDISHDERQVIRQPDIVIFEGLNVLGLAGDARLVASDFFDFSIYLDASSEDLETWFIDRRLILQQTAFRDPSSYFHHQKDLPPDEARRAARAIWRTINLVNLNDNILPTRARADLVLRKQADHTIGEVWLRA